jgi:hypothetical protein
MGGREAQFQHQWENPALRRSSRPYLSGEECTGQKKGDAPPSKVERESFWGRGGCGCHSSTVPVGVRFCAAQEETERRRHASSKRKTRAGSAAKQEHKQKCLVSACQLGTLRFRHPNVPPVLSQYCRKHRSRGACMNGCATLTPSRPPRVACLLLHCCQLTALLSWVFFCAPCARGIRFERLHMVWPYVLNIFKNRPTSTNMVQV